MEEKIYYYRHTNNEIYQLRFNNIIISLSGDARYIQKGRYWVEHISAEVAGLGELNWTRYGSKNTLRVFNIYDSVEKAIRGWNTNSITLADRGKGIKEEDLFKVSWNSPWDCTAFDLNFNLPEYIFTEVEKNALNMPYVYCRTWVWDGILAKKIGSVGKSVVGYGICNSYRSVMYDLISRDSIYDESIIGYRTKEDCVANNTIKVHAF